MKMHMLWGVVLLSVLAQPLHAGTDTNAQQGKALYLAGDFQSAKQIFENILAEQKTEETVNKAA